MLDRYLAGTIPQTIERGQILTASIPRNLPRDYDALRTICKQRIDGVINTLETLQLAVNTSFGQEQLRTFKRIVAELDLIETVVVAALSRADREDHKMNSLIGKITSEIEYPRITPVITTLSQNYFCIYPAFNLLCIPLLEGRFLLHLPDLYHELAHPFFIERNDPAISPFQHRFEDAMVEVINHFTEEKLKIDERRGPKQLYDFLHTWQRSWIRYWLEEFFCDLYGVYTLGPAFVWSHLHLAIKRGSDPYHISWKETSHPCDSARMDLMLYALSLLGFQSAAKQIAETWSDFLNQIEAQAEPEYHRCYPTNLMEIVAQRALDAVKEIKSRIATPATQDPIHNLLNQAWQEFWQNPSTYVEWEKQAVEKL